MKHLLTLLALLTTSLVFGQSPEATNDDGSCMVFGCTEENACNFNPEVEEDDGSCEYYTCLGCMDMGACNFDDTASLDDGTICVYAAAGYDCDGNCLGADINMNMVCDDYETGCMDMNACNFGLGNVFEANDECEYPSPNYDCDGNCLMDTDMDEICDENEVPGCTDDMAWNYDMNATDDDGSCEFEAGLGGASPPKLTHVNNVNSIGNATLHWDAFSPVGNEELLQIEIQVCDLQANPFSNNWHLVEVPSTGWVMPSFLYDANEQAHCFTAVQKTEENDTIAVSDMSEFLCSIHVEVSEGTTPGTVELEWNSPHALSGDSAGGPFILERLNVSSAQWELVIEYPDSPEGGFFTDSLESGDLEPHYRIRQLAANGENEHVSNVAASIGGCTDEEAWNYSPEAEYDDGSCEYFIGGCTDELAWNYSPEAEYDDGSCEYFASSCEFIGDSTWQGLELGVYPAEGLVHFVADTVFQELVVNVPALVQEPITGSSFATMSLSNLELNGMPPGLEFDVASDTVFALSQECISYSGQPYEPGEYEVELMGDLTVNFFGSPYVIEDFATPFFITVEDNPDPLYGCTYSLASNYSMFAAVDDGSCVFAGCTDPEANNYEKFATEDDGSCDFTPCVLECPTDLDQDGVTTTSDLLLFLGEFGEDCEVAASVWSCGDPLEYQGYDYATVQIGEQCWFAENLRNPFYGNGDIIPADLSDSEWWNMSSGAVAVYGEGNAGCNNYSPNGDACDEAWSLSEYGRLYNWYAVDDARGLCPTGWHVPSDGEWTVLTDHLGGASVAGGQMKSSYGWYNGGNGSNSSGFSGLPGGLRDYSGVFYNAGQLGFWWSSSPNGQTAWNRILYYEHGIVDLYDDFLRFGFSVRCLRDSE